MLTTMTASENLTFANNFFAHPGLNFIGTKQSCFKMKTNDGVAENATSVTSAEDQQIADLLERFGLADIDYEDECNTESSITEWLYPETECPERASRHLSGGGLLESSKTSPRSSFNGRVTPVESELTVISTNPFKNHMRLVLEDEKEDQPCGFCSTNPFSKLNDSSLCLEESSQSSNSTPSTCPTRAVSPDSSPNPFNNTTPRPNSFIFALPAPPTISQATQTAIEPPWQSGDQTEQDLQCLQKAIKALQMSGWYYENVNWQDSIQLLEDTEPGTFFVRDSADPHFLFSLSLQTVRGPTSVRLHYVNGRFRLDAEAKLIPNIPSFSSVIDLVEYYIANTKSYKKHKSKKKSYKEQVWVDVHGQVYSNILLSKPLIKNNKIPQLKHLCRLQVNDMLRHNFLQKQTKRSSQNTSIPMISLINSLCLPQSLEDFLLAYPYSK